MQITNTGLTATIGSNAGTTPTESPSLPIFNIKGDNCKGVITVNTGENPGGQLIGRVNFTQSFGSDNLLIEILPVNGQAHGLPCFAGGIENSGFELICYSQLTDLNVYQWSYTVTEIIEPNTP